MLSLTWMPDSLADQGLGSPSREDYVAVDARIAAEWPLREGGPRFVAGAEIGYALETPRDTAVGTGGSGDAGGLAWQLQASVYDFAPKHHIGVAIGRAAAGWLLRSEEHTSEHQSIMRISYSVLCSNKHIECRLLHNTY